MRAKATAIPVPRLTPSVASARGEQRQERVVGGLDAPQPVRPEPLVAGRFAADRAQVIAAQPHVDLHLAFLLARRPQDMTGIPALCRRAMTGQRTERFAGLDQWAR